MPERKPYQWDNEMIDTAKSLGKSIRSTELKEENPALAEWVEEVERRLSTLESFINNNETHK